MSRGRKQEEGATSEEFLRQCCEIYTTQL